MLYGDAYVPGEASELPTLNNNSKILIYIDAINLKVISEIEKELQTCDLISLVFLLYDVPDTALQRLTVMQRVSKDIQGNHVNVLSEWALHHAQSTPTWRQQFLEALVVCQLYCVIRKLGLDVPTIKAQFPSNAPWNNSFINPIKKVLYQLCENMNSVTFGNFKRTLESYEFNVMQYDTCELVLLHLMCQKVITINHSKGTMSGCSVENLINILKRDPDLKNFATMLLDLEQTISNLNNSEKQSTSTKTAETRSSTKTAETRSHLNIAAAKTDAENADFNEIYDMISEMNLDDFPDLNSDRESLHEVAKIQSSDRYPIKNKKRLGICCIINQEVFYPSKDSIARGTMEALQIRKGSTKDKILLEKTMRSLNFDIMTRENLDRKEMLTFIQEVINKKVSKSDSVFVLCILSHGIRGHVYAADSVAIKVDYIQSLLDDTVLLCGIPKVLILQACQVEGENSVPALAADSPQYNLRKTDFLIYWATAPELEAFRSSDHGSLFIQTLCGELNKNGHKEHLFDLFTRVTDKVTTLCMMKKCDQVPIFKSTFRKKLYLHNLND